MIQKSTRRIVDAMELAAGLFIGLMMLNTFVDVILRKFFRTGIPDSYDVGRMFLCILVFWGIAVATYRASHLTMDVLWLWLGPRGRVVLGVFSGLVTFGALTVLTLSMLDQVVQIRADRILTYDLRLPLWPFIAAAWLGTCVGLVTLALRQIASLFAGRDAPDGPGTGAQEQDLS